MCLSSRSAAHSDPLSRLLVCFQLGRCLATEKRVINISTTRVSGAQILPPIYECPPSTTVSKYRSLPVPDVCCDVRCPVAWWRTGLGPPVGGTRTATGRSPRTDGP